MILSHLSVFDMVGGKECRWRGALRSRSRKSCVRVEDCEEEVVSKFFEGRTKGDLRHRHDIEDVWRIAGESEDEGRMDAILGWIGSPTETQNINWLIY